VVIAVNMPNSESHLLVIATSPDEARTAMILRVLHVFPLYSVVVALPSASWLKNVDVIEKRNFWPDYQSLVWLIHVRVGYAYSGVTFKKTTQ
jgi:hypothetical protein